MQRKHGIDDVPVCGLKSGGGGDIYKRIKYKLNVRMYVWKLTVDLSKCDV